MFQSSSLVIWFYTVCITIHNFLEAISLDQGYVFSKFMEIIVVSCLFDLMQTAEVMLGRSVT